MIERSIDTWDSLMFRWRKPVGIVSVAWFALICAAQAKFIDLPELRLLTGMPAMIVAALWNGTWWGFLYPRIHSRRVERAASEEATNG